MFTIKPIDNWGCACIEDCPYLKDFSDTYDFQVLCEKFKEELVQIQKLNKPARCQKCMENIK